MGQENLWSYPYPSERKVVMGSRGAVATSQPLAALAGMEMMLAGGNAVDAAVAMAICLTVVEPTSNGIGGDAFALVWEGRLFGLNASGKSPAALTRDRLEGLEKMPESGWLPVTVPGAVSAWRALWERWGELPFERLFEPAIRYAEEGFPVSPVTARAWKRAAARYLRLDGEAYSAFQEVFFPSGRAPRPGEIWRSPWHAKTLRELAQSGGESFYTGPLAERMAAFSEATGGLLTREDLAEHAPEWVDPISTSYRGLTVWEMPPNGQGIAALMALNILEGFDLARLPRESAESYHLQIEAMKLALADVREYVADPDAMQVSNQDLLDRAYAEKRRSLIGESAIPLAEPGLARGGTVYLAAADGELMVSLIQSNYMGFGSGILVPGTGIALQNRGAGFVLDEGHPNVAGPRKRPFHTIIPGFLTREGRPLGPFGVMGGPMQPQGHVQVVVNMADYGMNPQSALDAPRWQFVSGNEVWLEQAVPRSVALALADRGHRVQVMAESGAFGRGQIIVHQDRAFIAASEPRADGLALAW